MPCVRLCSPIRVSVLNSYHKQMFGPIRKIKSGPGVQEKLMGMLKDSCSHQLGEPEMNRDPHEEPIPSLVSALPLSHVSHSTPLCLPVCEFPFLALPLIMKTPCVRVPTECIGCFLFVLYCLLFKFLSGINRTRLLFVLLSFRPHLLSKVITDNYFSY